MKKVMLGLASLGLVLSFALAQMQAGFKGTTAYQQGMSLEDAYGLANVSEEEAILAAQQLIGSTADVLEAEITVVDGFIVWAVDLGTQVIYIDVADASISSTQEVVAEAYAGEGEDYEDEDDDYEDEEHEDEDDEDEDDD